MLGPGPHIASVSPVDRAQASLRQGFVGQAIHHFENGGPSLVGAIVAMAIPNSSAVWQVKKCLSGVGLLNANSGYSAKASKLKRADSNLPLG